MQRKVVHAVLRYAVFYPVVVLGAAILASNDVGVHLGWVFTGAVVLGGATATTAFAEYDDQVARQQKRTWPDKFGDSALGGKLVHAVAAPKVAGRAKAYLFSGGLCTFGLVGIALLARSM